jgi:hypothetical protein
MKNHWQTMKTYFPVIFLLLLAAWPAPAAEPVYNGKALSEWLVTMKTNSSDAEAVRKIGTNALPTLMNIISVEQWSRKRVLGKLKSLDFREAAGNKNIPTEVFRGLAVDGFAVLGTNAEPAIPQLKRLLYNNPECRPEVSCALAQIGPKGFAVLTNAMNDDNLVAALVFTIGQKGGGDKQTVTRILIGALQNPDPQVRGTAAEFLAGKDAELAVPALAQTLDDKEGYPWQRALVALESYGPAAKGAVPKLWSVFTNNLNVLFLDVLRKIDPETAGRAEEHLISSGPLNGARRAYTKTLLTNGMELITGGYFHREIPSSSNEVISSVQLFDTNTGKWKETGEMHTARSSHAAMLLPNGKVLVVGGLDKQFHDLSSAELYDPATGTWAETGSMNKARYSFVALLQSNGKVLVFSGVGGRYSAATDKELYNPATGIWKQIPEEPGFDKALYNDYTDKWSLPPRHKDYE